jgi:hypothetical protein
LNRVGHDGHSPLDAANRSGATEVVQWLRSQGCQVGEKINVTSQSEIETRFCLVTRLSDIHHPYRDVPK